MDVALIKPHQPPGRRTKVALFVKDPESVIHARIPNTAVAPTNYELPQDRISKAARKVPETGSSTVQIALNQLTAVALTELFQLTALISKIAESSIPKIAHSRTLVAVPMESPQVKFVL